MSRSSTLAALLVSAWVGTCALCVRAQDAAPGAGASALDMPLPLGQAPDKPSKPETGDVPTGIMPTGNGTASDTPSTAPSVETASLTPETPAVNPLIPLPPTESKRNFPEGEDAYVRPSPYPISWELEFKHSEPKRLVITVPGDAAPTAYWYITYMVTNHSDQAANFDPSRDKERLFYPHFDMRTQEGRVIQSDDGISNSVFAAVKQKAANQYLENPKQMGGTILLGDDQARESVAIWKEPLQRMGSFSLFASGMWGEIAVAKGSDGKSLKDAKGQPIELHKSLMMNYHVDGDDIHPQTVRALDEKFIMR